MQSLGGENGTSLCAAPAIIVTSFGVCSSKLRKNP